MNNLLLAAAAVCLFGAKGFVQNSVGADRSKPIKAGAIFSVTGPAAFLGAPEEKTAKLFVNQINAEGGINGQKLELVLKDSAASAEKAVSFAKQLIEEEKVLAIIGPSTSGETLRIKDSTFGHFPAFLPVTSNTHDTIDIIGQSRVLDSPTVPRRCPSKKTQHWHKKWHEVEGLDS
jgi:ABC-type branched-subunit amino acid transport system substrate-binding protein